MLPSVKRNQRTGDKHMHTTPPSTLTHPETPVRAADVQAPTLDQNERERAAISEAGRDRSESDLQAALDAGFAPRQPMFDRGYAITSPGAERAARRSRIAFEQQPLVRDACEAFAAQIKSERRSDAPVVVGQLKLRPSGCIEHEARSWLLNRRALKTLVTRLNIGGAGYLVDRCWPELRALNVNKWIDRITADERAAHDANVIARASKPTIKPHHPKQLIFRTRGNVNAPQREVYGIVTPSYTSFDVDRIAQALALAAPEGARGSVSYNGQSARFDVLFHTTREPSEFVAGEFFRAGVGIRTDDTGLGSIVTLAYVHQHLCNNMVMIDRNSKDVARIQHRGSVEELANRFRNGFDLALNKIDHFLAAWGYAKKENVIERAQAATTITIPTNIEEALPGLLNGILDRDLVPMRGRAKNLIPKLVEMWNADESSDAGLPSRTAIVNAFTRYAHEIETDLDRTDEIQIAASRLLFGPGDRDPNPLPYLPFAA